ncbi:MAG: 16S rRNA (cytosine967-C5)-methyltransferase [Halioglobus sp.]|jgi:16S rRNA (cytosine967-C5)-methyltransferase
MALDARAASAGIIKQVIAGKSLNQVLPSMLPKVAERDRPLVQQLCYGTLRQQPRLEGIVKQLLDKPLRAKDGDVFALLLMGLYQLDDMRVPDHAAVAETVGASRALKKPWAKGLINALLRRYLREREELIETLDAAARSAHPKWLYQKIYQQWPEQADSIIQANNGQPPMSLRVNALKMTADVYLERLASEGIHARLCEHSPCGVRLDQPMDVELIPGFAEGEVSVQDEAAQMAALFLDAQPKERILDACSAPGGKACHIIETQSQLNELVAADVDEQRLVKVTENLQRLKLTATVQRADAAEPRESFQAESFDRILVDAPCSASGVIRRHPDVKILRRPEDITEMAEQQLHILKGLWPLLKPGGSLLYATCSIFEEENSSVVNKFLQSNPDAAYQEGIHSGLIQKRYGQQLLPNANGGDGLFYAMLRKQI